ncbi:MAG: EI24 domain-containing protein [Cyanobacteriota bacterium]|jgi:CysZ protein
MTQHLLSGFGFWSGAGYPFRAGGLLRRYPSLAPYLVIPLLLNLILGLWLYWQLWQWGENSAEIGRIYLGAWWREVAGQLPEALGFLEEIFKGVGWLLDGLLKVFLLIIAGFILSQLGVIIGAPWYEKLSEKLEKILLGHLFLQDLGFGAEIRRSIAFEAKKLVLLLGIGVPSLFLNIFPGLGSLAATAVGVTLTATLACLDFLNPPLERRRLSFRAKLGFIGKSLPASAGFGLTCLILVSIPVVNLATIPLCILAGTLFFSERLYPRYFAPKEENSP